MNLRRTHNNRDGDNDDDDDYYCTLSFIFTRSVLSKRRLRQGHYQPRIPGNIDTA